MCLLVENTSDGCAPLKAIFYWKSWKSREQILDQLDLFQQILPFANIIYEPESFRNSTNFWHK